MDKKAILKKAVKVLLVLGLAGCLFLFLINLYMIRKEKPNIISSDDAAALGDVDCIMVLGCSVRPDGTPSGMLRDRLDKGQLKEEIAKWENITLGAFANYNRTFADVHSVSAMLGMTAEQETYDPSG